MTNSRRVIKSALAVFLLYSFLVAGVWANALSVPLATEVDVQLNITTPTEDYVIQNQRQYAANIASMDATLAEFKFNYESELQTIITQRDLLLIQLNQFDNKLYPRRLLNDLDKHCAQKYEGKLYTSAYVNSSITTCATSALSQYNAYAAEPAYYRNWLNNYYTSTLVTRLNSCKTSHPNLESQNYTNCATQEIATADSNTERYEKSFNREMQIARCSAEGRVRTAIDCSFKIVYNAAFLVGETNRLIENCSQGLEFCPKCDPPKPTYYCPNQLSVSLNISDYRNPTIKNPFYGLTGRIDCVLLNLGEPSWS